LENSHRVAFLEVSFSSFCAAAFAQKVHLNPSRTSLKKMKLIVVALLLLLQSVTATTPQQEIAALERLYDSTGGSAGHWNFPTMNSCISEYASHDASVGYLNLTGASWDFKKIAAGY